MPAPAHATGILECTGQVTPGRAVLVGDISYLFVDTAVAADFDVLIGSSADHSLQNLVRAVNRSGGLIGSDYMASVANPLARASLNAVDNLVTFVAVAAGAAGNGIPLETDDPALDAPGTLSGAEDSAWPEYALASEDEVSKALRVSISKVPYLAMVAGRVVELMEAGACRPFVARAPDDPVEEWHDLEVGQSFIVVRTKPIRLLTALYVGESDVPIRPEAYVIAEQAGMIMLKGVPAGGRPLNTAMRTAFVDFPEDAYTRLSGTLFPPIVGAGRAVYKGGFAATEDVPGDLRSAFLSIMARVYREEERKSQGLSVEISGGFGIGSKFSDEVITKEAAVVLERWKSRSMTARV